MRGGEDHPLTTCVRLWPSSSAKVSFAVVSCSTLSSGFAMIRALNVTGMVLDSKAR